MHGATRAPSHLEMAAVLVRPAARPFFPTINRRRIERGSSKEKGPGPARTAGSTAARPVVGRFRMHRNTEKRVTQTPRGTKIIQQERDPASHGRLPAARAGVPTRACRSRRADPTGLQPPSASAGSLALRSARAKPRLDPPRRGEHPGNQATRKSGNRPRVGGGTAQKTARPDLSRPFLSVCARLYMQPTPKNREKQRQNVQSNTYSAKCEPRKQLKITKIARMDPRYVQSNTDSAKCVQSQIAKYPLFFSQFSSQKDSEKQRQNVQSNTDSAKCGQSQIAKYPLFFSQFSSQ